MHIKIICDYDKFRINLPISHKIGYGNIAWALGIGEMTISAGFAEHNMFIK